MQPVGLVEEVGMRGAEEAASQEAGMRKVPRIRIDGTVFLLSTLDSSSEEERRLLRPIETPR